MSSWNNGSSIASRCSSDYRHMHFEWREPGDMPMDTGCRFHWREPRRNHPRRTERVAMTSLTSLRLAANPDCPPSCNHCAAAILVDDNRQRFLPNAKQSAAITCHRFHGTGRRLLYPGKLHQIKQLVDHSLAMRPMLSLAKAD